MTSSSARGDSVCDRNSHVNLHLMFVYTSYHVCVQLQGDVSFFNMYALFCFSSGNETFANFYSDDLHLVISDIGVSKNQ